MEKQGVVSPGRTPVLGDTSHEKTAQPKTRGQQIAALDADFTKRAADTAANALKPASGS